MKLLNDTWLLFRRGMNTTLRNPAWVIMGLFQPICYMLLFAPLLASIASVPGFPQGGGINVFVPGLLVMLGLLSAAFVGFGVIADLRAGVIERFRVTPVSPLALLLGSALRDIVVLLVQSLLLVLVAWLFGLQIHPLGVALAMGLLVLLGLIMASCSYALALVFKDENALASIIQFFVLPLMLLSGIMLPLTLAPAWLRTLATFTPFSHVVDAVRALFIGNIGDASVLRGTIILIVLTLLTVLWAGRSFRHATA
jgi:ABC-2 type transport system permease protein